MAGQIVASTAFDPENIANRYWEVVHSDGPWQAEFRFSGSLASGSPMMAARTAGAPVSRSQRRPAYLRGVNIVT